MKSCGLFFIKPHRIVVKTWILEEMGLSSLKSLTGFEGYMKLRGHENLSFKPLMGKIEVLIVSLELLRMLIVIVFFFEISLL